MKKFIIFVLVAVLMFSVAGCKKDAAQAGASEPEASYPSLPRPTAPPKDPTEPGETEPEAEGKIIGSMLPVVENMICDIQWGDRYMHLLSPRASDVYQYIKQNKPSASKENPTDPNKEVSQMLLLFRVDGNDALRIWVYSDDYVAIYQDAANGSSPAPMYKFPAGTYKSIAMTLEAENGGI